MIKDRKDCAQHVSRIAQNSLFCRTPNLHKAGQLQRLFWSLLDAGGDLPDEFPSIKSPQAVLQLLLEIDCSNSFRSFQVTHTETKRELSQAPSIRPIYGAMRKTDKSADQHSDSWIVHHCRTRYKSWPCAALPISENINDTRI